MSAAGFVADFDSATAMLRALSRFLHGRDFPYVGQSPLMRPLASAVGRLPVHLRERVYTLGGLAEAIPPSRMHRVDSEAIARWATAHYPTRPYPAVMVGSSSGALVHLCAALMVPWLPQTFLVPVRLSAPVDEPKTALAMGSEPGRQLLEANPKLQLHHMHDASQDRLMVRFMGYFRVKWRRLPDWYKRFLAARLQPGGAIYVVECRRRWPTTRVGERHVFQHGALGGAGEREFLDGGPRVEEFLDRYHSRHRRWDAPQPDGESPEAEWGFEPALRDDLREFARRRGFRLAHLVFDEPEHLSPLVADLHRAWYQARNMRANRLLVGSFFLVEPHWALRTGSVPFWLKFNMEPSAAWLEDYLDSRPPFDEIGMMLFAHGTESIGLPPIERWRRLLGRARRRGRFLGVDEEAYPRDFATYGRYRDAIRKAFPARYPLPGPLPLQAFESFAQTARWPGALIG